MADFKLSGFIASRLQFRKGKSFSSTVIRISGISIALGVAILVISVVIQAGFRNEVNDRIFSFGGHLSIRQFSSGSLYEESPVEQNSDFIRSLKKMPEIQSVQSFSYKPVLLSNEKEVAGLVLKGIDAGFNFPAFRNNFKNLPRRHFPDSGKIWVSGKLARQLNLEKGSKVVAFFLQDPPRYRKLEVESIFETALEDVDEHIAFVSIDLIREINGWPAGSAGGFEVFVKDFQLLPITLAKIEKIIPFDMGTEPVTQTHSQLFEWLDIIGRNVVIMFVLIAMVAGFNMAATLLIMVMERRQMIGILKALGADDALIRGIFIRNGLKILIRGLLAGNLAGIGFAFVQWKFRLIPLNPVNYYLSSVPVGWDWVSILGINAGVILISWLVILLPVKLVNRIRPAEAVRA
jgi:lipoprotein-releasing system permease protein